MALRRKKLLHRQLRKIDETLTTMAKRRWASTRAGGSSSADGTNYNGNEKDNNCVKADNDRAKSTMMSHCRMVKPSFFLFSISFLGTFWFTRSVRLSLISGATPVGLLWLIRFLSPPAQNSIGRAEANSDLARDIAEQRKLVKKISNAIRRKSDDDDDEDDDDDDDGLRDELAALEAEEDDSEENQPPSGQQPRPVGLETEDDEVLAELVAWAS